MFNKAFDKVPPWFSDNMLYLGGDPGSVHRQLPPGIWQLVTLAAPGVWSFLALAHRVRFWMEYCFCVCVALTFRCVQIDVKHPTEKYSGYLGALGTRKSVIWSVISLFLTILDLKPKSWRVTLSSRAWKNHIVFTETDRLENYTKSSKQAIFSAFPFFFYSAA